MRYLKVDLQLGNLISEIDRHIQKGNSASFKINCVNTFFKSTDPLQWYSLPYLTCTVIHIIYNTCKSVWKMLTACSSDACCNIFHHLSLLWHIWRGSETDLDSHYFGFSESAVLWFNDSVLNLDSFAKMKISGLTQRMEVRLFTHGALKITKGETILCYLREKSGFFLVKWNEEHVKSL